MIIRLMQQKDRAEVLDMMVEFYNSPAILHHAPVQVLEKDIDDCVSDLPFIEGFVAEKDGAIAGYSMVSKGYSTEYGGISVMIEDLFVKDSYRGYGIGASLLKYIEEKYRGIAVRLRLEVEPKNIGAIKLYERCGLKKLDYTQMTKEI